MFSADKENDVVARAKLDAKKKFGSNPSTNPIVLSNGQIEKPSPSDERDSYIRRRIRDDFTRLMNRQTKVFADEISKLEPFQAGFSRKFFPATSLGSGWDANLVTAGTLLVNVLPALAEKEVSRTSQLAADALIDALETGLLSPESFFDAVALLAENRQILVGSDRILAQLFSRSSSSGNSKVLRTSSGADSKLFATTNGPFIIYNTIENTEKATSASSRHSNRSFQAANQTPVRASPRERRPTTKMLSVSEVSTRPRTRTSTSPRASPSKVLKLSRPSKLRGSVSFANSPSPPPAPPAKRVKLRHDSVSAAQDQDDLHSPEPELTRQPQSINQYQSEQTAPPQITLNEDLIKTLLESALLASQEETDSESELENQGVNAQSGTAETQVSGSARLAPAKHNGQQQLHSLPTSSKPTAHGDACQPSLRVSATAEQIAKFNRIVEQLPASVANLNHEQAKQVAALYDQLAEGPTFERAKELGLSYPEIPRPFADRDGWKLTGVVNEYDEEIVEIDPQSWVYPPERSEDTQQPLRRLKHKALVEQEQVFGFPPIAGFGNAPLHTRQRVERVDEENVAYEKLMSDVRKAAANRGLPYDKALGWEQLARSIRKFDADHGITFEGDVTTSVVDRVHDEPDDGILGPVEASENSDAESDDDSEYEPDVVVKNDVEEAWTGSNGAQISTFVAVNGRRESLRKLRDRPASLSSAQGYPKGAMDVTTVLSVSGLSPHVSRQLIASDQPSHADMSPPRSATKYNTRPSPLSGTFNTFKGPITSSNTPTASPIGTPTMMKLNFNVPKKQASTSPAPSPSATTGTRRASTASMMSTSSLASRPPSTQPLDIDNTNAYNTAKGYINSNNTSGSANTSNPGSSPGGLSGGFPHGGVIINAPDKRGDGRGQRRKSKAPDFKMTVHKAGKEGPKLQARAVRGGTVLKFT